MTAQIGKKIVSPRQLRYDVKSYLSSRSYEQKNHLWSTSFQHHGTEVIYELPRVCQGCHYTIFMIVLNRCLLLAYYLTCKTSSMSCIKSGGYQIWWSHKLNCGFERGYANELPVFSSNCCWAPKFLPLIELMYLRACKNWTRVCQTRSDRRLTAILLRAFKRSVQVAAGCTTSMAVHDRFAIFSGQRTYAVLTPSV